MLSPILLISIVIVAIFIFFCLVYNRKDMLDTNLDTNLEKQSELLEIIMQAKLLAKDKIENHVKQQLTNKNLRERFNTVLSTPLTDEEAEQYLIQLNFLADWVNNNTGDNGIMQDINQLIQQANSQRIVDKTTLINILSNMYAMSYLEMIKRQNAEAYKVYAKYNNPRNNKYYQQYLS